MKYLLPFIILLAACAAPRKATQTEQEIAALNNLIAGYMLEVPVASPITVPGGMVALPAPCADFDSGAVKSVAGQLQVRCPDHQVNVDSLVRANAVFKLALAARALADAKGKLADQKVALLEAEKSQLSMKLSSTRKLLIWISVGAGLLAAGLILRLVYKLKTGGFGLFKIFRK